MGTDNTPDQTGNPKPDKGDRLPREMALIYDTEPIVNLTKAINQQTTSEQQQNNDSGNIAREQIAEQKRANHISKKTAFISAVLTAITIGVFIWNIFGVNAATRAANAADSTVKLTRYYDRVSRI
jgi:hypothetical protein